MKLFFLARKMIIKSIEMMRDVFVLSPFELYIASTSFCMSFGVGLLIFLGLFSSVPSIYHLVADLDGRSSCI